MARRRESPTSPIVSGKNALLAAALAGCGPEAAEVEDFAELCGQVGPVQVLPLDDNEIVGRTQWSVARHDDRWLYAVRSFDTLELELVVQRIYGAVALDADRWIYMARVDYETDVLGDLELIDDTTGETRVIDRSVSPFFEDLEPHETSGLPPWRTDEIVYQVRDPDGSRTGLWRANFAQ